MGEEVAGGRELGAKDSGAFPVLVGSEGGEEDKCALFARSG